MRSVIPCLAALACLGPSPLASQDVVAEPERPLVVSLEANLTSPDDTHEYFGGAASLDADGTRALVGAFGSFTDATGSARVLRRTGTTWSLEATLRPPDVATFDEYGSSVALSADGTRAVVGAWGDVLGDGGARAGTARVFSRSGTAWALEATLTASDADEHDRFGADVAIDADGSRILVGAYRDSTASAARAGSARVFVRSGTTWTEEATLNATDGEAIDEFGLSVALSADAGRAIVGASWDDHAAGDDAGTAHVFLRTGSIWAHEARLVAPDGAADDHFGWVVLLDAEALLAVVTADEDDGAAGENVGSAHVFTRTGTTWAHVATLGPPLEEPMTHFGFSAALAADGRRLLVAAPGLDTARGMDTGGVHVMVRHGTTFVDAATLVADDGVSNDQFGHAVALSPDGSRCIVGVPHDEHDTGMGRARFYALGASTPVEPPPPPAAPTPAPAAAPPEAPSSGSTCSAGRRSSTAVAGAVLAAFVLPGVRRPRRRPGRRPPTFSGP